MDITLFSCVLGSGLKANNGCFKKRAAAGMMQWFVSRNNRTLMKIFFFEKFNGFLFEVQTFIFII
jgi:hypothetical protein